MLVSMSNENNPTARFLDARNIATRCKESLERLPGDDEVRPNVEALLDLAEKEMESAAAEMPF